MAADDGGGPSELYGVDIHAGYQAGISIATLKDEGYTFVVTKASEGVHIPPLNGSSAAFKARYLSWLQQTRAQGMVPGLYHWIDSSASGADQARFFHGLVVEAGGPYGMLIQLDCEDDASYATVQGWVDEWNRLSSGHPFLIYTGGWWWGPRGWDGVSLTPHLWHSRYLSADADTISDDPATFAARVPDSWWTPGYGGWPVATILQFTSRGDAGSLGNDVDLNVFRGTLEDLRALTGEGDDVGFDNVYTNKDGNQRTVEQMIVDTFDQLFCGAYNDQFPKSHGAALDRVEEGMDVELPPELEEAIRKVVREELDKTHLPAVPGTLERS
jgi:hypothetical protein